MLHIKKARKTFAEMQIFFGIVLIFGALGFSVINLRIELSKKEEEIERLNQQKIKLENENKLLESFKLRKKAIDVSGLDIPEKFEDKHIKKVFEECKKNNIPPRIAFRLIKAESNFNKNSKSSVGAKGFLQIMPNTYQAYSKKIKIKNHDEMANIEVGIFYLKTLQNFFRKESGSDKWRLTLLSYNYGIGKVGSNKKHFLGENYKNYKYVNFILS